MKKLLLSTLVFSLIFSLGMTLGGERADAAKNCEAEFPLTMTASPSTFPSSAPYTVTLIAYGGPYTNCIEGNIGGSVNWRAFYNFDYDGNGTWDYEEIRSKTSSQTVSRSYTYPSNSNVTPIVRVIVTDVDDLFGPYGESIDTETIQAPPPPPPIQTDVNLYIDGYTGNGTLSRNAGTTVGATWDSEGFSECFSYVTTGQTVSNWPSGGSRAVDNAVAVTLKSEGENKTGLDAGNYNFRLQCEGSISKLFNHSNSLASNAFDFLKNFVAIAYASTGPNYDDVAVNANAYEHSILYVKASGVSNVPITVVSGQNLGGTTETSDYPKINTGDGMSGTVSAPLTFGGKDFAGWTGSCGGAVSPQCSITVDKGSVETYYVNYSSPVDPQDPDDPEPETTPDLEIAGAVAYSPANPEEGDVLTFTAIARNRGSASTGQSTVTRLMIDLYSNGDNSIWDVTSDQSTANLGSGATETETWSSAWTAVAGNHKVWACTDAMNVVAEPLENNNCAEIFITVTEPPLPQQYATVNVNSSGASGVAITRNSGPSDIGGTTNYTRIYEENVNAVIVAPQTSGGATFSSWSGCSSNSSGRNCNINVDLGETITATASYTVPFNYSLSNSGTTNAEKQSQNVYTQNTITKTLTAGSSQGVSLAVSGMPSGVSATVSNNPCSPTCTSTITFTVSPSAPTGNHTITVTGSPLSKTTQFTLSITGSPMTVSCSANPSVALIGETVTWTAQVSGGTAPYTYSWSGTNIPTSPAPSTNPYSISYSTVGQKLATATVTDAGGSTSAACVAGTAQINFDPDFEEF